ncbi:MAG: hypothetical protein IME98_06060 [Proteobacteria bacterium]|nr:hypothetical protein [Pseudomonadota bacterium]
MNLLFLERVNEDGNFEVTITEGAEELKGVIEKSYVFPEKLVLTAEQREENKEGLRDLLTGAFCFQEIAGISFRVVNEKGELIPDYMRSLYDDLSDIEVPLGFDASGGGGGTIGGHGGGDGGQGGGDGGHGGDHGGGCSH